MATATAPKSLPIIKLGKGQVLQSATPFVVLVGEKCLDSTHRGGIHQISFKELAEKCRQAEEPLTVIEVGMLTWRDDVFVKNVKTE